MTPFWRHYFITEGDWGLEQVRSETSARARSRTSLTCQWQVGADPGRAERERSEMMFPATPINKKITPKVLFFYYIRAGLEPIFALFSF